MERVIPPGHASMRQTEMGEQFDKTLFAALDAIEGKGIQFAMIGGIAASALSRPRSTHDIDIFLRPEDADAALEALAQAGFETEKIYPTWLYKGWMGEMMVDVIFKSQGDIYFDNEMCQRAQKINYHGRVIPAVAPEDLVVIKSAVANEGGPHHWHDALAILSHATLDWPYLLKRARKAARRILAVLIYAQSNDIWIPNSVIQHLYQSIFGEVARPGEVGVNANSGAPVPQPAYAYAQNATQPHPGAYTQQAGSQNFTPQSYGQQQVAKAAPTSSFVTNSPAPKVVQNRSQPMGAANETSGNQIDTSAASGLGTGAYLSEKLREAIAQDSRIGALDIKVYLVGSNKIVAKGEVQSEEQRLAILEVITDHAIGFEIDNQVQATKLTEPTVEEVV